MDAPRVLSELCAKQRINARQLAEKAGLEERRVRAILDGRWTPSPTERDCIAAAFGLGRDDIAWGHRTPVEHLYGHGPQFGRTP